MSYGHTELYGLAEEHGYANVEYATFQRIMLSRYSWITSQNLSRLFSQGMYYALKEGL